MSLQRASTHASRRAFSSASTSRQQTCLVGAPHPVSHLRPVIYSGTRLPASNSKYDEKHPYSLAEFRESTIYSPTAVKGNPKSDVEWELNWRLMENDAKDHAFWVDSNTRFNKAKKEIVDAHADLSPQVRDAQLEASLSTFYKNWVAQEAKRQRQYTSGYYRRTCGGVWLAMRTIGRSLTSRLL